MGWLYNRAFEDPDGHIFEAVWVDMAAAAAATGE
jgi:predicted lactoylglutathione lyase